MRDLKSKQLLKNHMLEQKDQEIEKLKEDLKYFENKLKTEQVRASSLVASHCDIPQKLFSSSLCFLLILRKRVRS